MCPPLCATKRCARWSIINSGRQSQVSAQHAVGVVLTRQRAGLAEFSDAAVNDRRVRTLGAKLAFHDDAAMSIDCAHLAVRYADGMALESHVAAARGSLDNPLLDAELETKLRTLCEYGGSGVHAGRLIGALWTLQDCAGAGAIMALAASSPETS